MAIRMAFLVSVLLAFPFLVSAQGTEGEGVWHTVQPGETLSEISLRFLGDSSRFFEIAQINSVSDPGSIQIGQKLFIPGPKSWLLAERGDATWYGARFRGGKTKNGEVFDPEKLTAASNTLPLGSIARVTNVANGESVIVRINDTGDFTSLGVTIDLSRAAFALIAPLGKGRIKVRIELLEMK